MFEGGEANPLQGMQAKAVARTLLGKCYRLRLHNPNTLGHLFDSLVRPVLCHGCGVWGPDMAADPCKPNKSMASTEADKAVVLPFPRQTWGWGRRPQLARCSLS